MFQILCGEPEAGAWLAAKNLPTFKEAVRTARDLRRHDAGLGGTRWRRVRGEPGKPWFWRSRHGWMQIMRTEGTMR